jgi:hypothetical protein
MDTAIESGSTSETAGASLAVGRTRIASALSDWLKENLKDGERYVGILMGENGAPEQHIILLPGEIVGQSWANCKAWAEQQGGELPTRREQSLLLANLKAEFQPRWYWSGEQHAGYSGYAWGQHFGNGDQDDGRKSYEGRARAVRRLPI